MDLAYWHEFIGSQGVESVIKLLQLNGIVGLLQIYTDWLNLNGYLVKH